MTGIESPGSLDGNAKFQEDDQKDQQDSRVRIMWKETKNTILKKLI
jgi:hypothetical protein